METEIGQWAREPTGIGADRLRKGLIKDVGFLAQSETDATKLQEVEWNQ